MANSVSPPERYRKLERQYVNYCKRRRISFTLYGLGSLLTYFSWYTHTDKALLLCALLYGSGGLLYLTAEGLLTSIIDSLTDDFSKHNTRSVRMSTHERINLLGMKIALTDKLVRATNKFL